jgi:hypothetical protein
VQSRTKRQALDDEEDQLERNPLFDQMNQHQAKPPRMPDQQASMRDMVVFNQTIAQEESRLHQLMRQIQSSAYMPTREQTIQMASTLLTLLLMMLLGPAIGSQAGVIQMMVKQAVPLLVAASVHFAANQAMPMASVGPASSPVTSAQIAPVQVQPSRMGQAF